MLGEKKQKYYLSDINLLHAFRNVNLASGSLCFERIGKTTQETAEQLTHED